MAQQSFSNSMIRLLLAAIAFTTLYILWLLFHLYYFDPLYTKSNENSNPTPNQKELLNMELLLQHPCTNPTSSLTITNITHLQNTLPHHIHSKYDPNKFKMSDDITSFNLSIFNADDYSTSINNHYNQLYINISYSTNPFAHIKPNCIHHYTQALPLVMCFIHDCHDKNYHQTVSKLRQRNTDNQHYIPLAYKSAKGINPYDNDIDEEHSLLPNPWYRYRANIITNEPYQHLIIRPNNIRGLRGSKSTACFISYKYKFVFVHVLKSGGTSMAGFLCYALCNTTVIKECDTTIFTKKSCKKINTSHPEFFYFSIVRNPYNRMFSLWSHTLIMGFEKAAKRRTDDLGSKTARGRRDDLMDKFDAKINGKIAELKATRYRIKMNRYDIKSYSRMELLKLFAEFVWERRFIGIQRRKSRKTGVSSDHIYEQHWWIFNNKVNCPIVDFIAHLENIEYDIEYIINLIDDNRLIMNYYRDNGEYWKVNTFGSNIKHILYNNSNDDGLDINSLTDIYKLATNVTGINVPRWVYQLYQNDFELFGYDKNRIEHNLLIDHN